MKIKTIKSSMGLLALAEEAVESDSLPVSEPGVCVVFLLRASVSAFDEGAGLLFSVIVPAAACDAVRGCGAV